MLLVSILHLTISIDGNIVIQGLSMNTVTVSTKYQVVIPKEIRDNIGLKAGTSMEIINYGNRIELIPIQPMKNLKGVSGKRH